MYSKPSAPRSIGGVLDDGFRLAQASFSKTWPLALAGEILLALPLFIFKVQNGAQDLDDIQAYLMMSQSPGSSLLYALIAFVWAGLQNAINAQTASVASGSPRTIGESTSIGFRLLPRTLWLGFLLTFGFLLIAICFVIPGSFLGDPARLLIAALALIPLLYYFGRIFLANVIFVVEDLGAYPALLRSWHLTQNHYWRAGAILSLLAVILLVVGLLATLVTFLAGGLLAAVLGARSTLTLTLVELISAAANMVVMALTSAMLLSIYYDLKLRQEGT